MSERLPEEVKEEAVETRKFSLLDWWIHFGIAINLVVVVLLVYYSLR